MGEVVPKETRAERSKMLHILSDKKRRYFNDQFIGKDRPVLFETMKNGKIQEMEKFKGIQIIIFKYKLMEIQT